MNMPVAQTLSDPQAMELALAQARLAAGIGEVPVGSIVVRAGKVLATGHNQPIAASDPSAHAEIVALRAAASALGNYRLEDCTLYVTLEPCAMCAGALLNARVARVVYGAEDPKSGAAGSVIDVLHDARLNHGTRVEGGVLADASRALLREFFQARRSNPDPLREDALRTPDERFAGLSDDPWQQRYVSDLPALAGLRLHYLDEGPRDAPLAWFCVHGRHGWSYQYRHFTAGLLRAGHRVVVPDLIGFGRSDKPKKASWHRFARHRDILQQLVEYLDLHDVVLVGHGFGAALAFTLPHEHPDRYRGILFLDAVLPGCAGVAMAARGDAGKVLQTARGRAAGWKDEDMQSLDAPYPDRGHAAAQVAFEQEVPAELSGAARAIWSRSSGWMLKRWSGHSLVIAGAALAAHDPVGIAATAGVLRSCPPPLVLAAPDRLLPTAGRDMAERALAHFSG